MAASFAAPRRAHDRRCFALRLGVVAPRRSRSADADARPERCGRFCDPMNCSCIDSALKHDSVVSVSRPIE
jgi:hypothetical protein